MGQHVRHHYGEKRFLRLLDHMNSSRLDREMKVHTRPDAIKKSWIFLITSVPYGTVRMSLKQILLDKSTLAAENTTSILTLMSFFAIPVTTFVSMHQWGIEMSIPLMVFLSLSSILTISLDIGFRIKPDFPRKSKSPKANKIRYTIFGIAMLMTLSQSGAMSLLIIDDLEKINSSTLPSYTDEYKIIALIVYEAVVPLLYIKISNRIITEIQNNNNEWKAFPFLRWSEIQ